VARIEVPGGLFSYDSAFQPQLAELEDRVQSFRKVGKLDSKALKDLSSFFRVRTIYNSNAIEGNALSEGETRRVVEQGITIAGRSLKDHAEAHNLADALDYFEDLAVSHEPISEVDIRQVHSAILKGIDDINAGSYRTGDVEVGGSEYQPTPYESVRPEMQEFGNWFQKISTKEVDFHPVVLAAAAHAWFVQIHPFIDGNGRTARILLNLVLMRYGYPITVISLDERQRYYDVLEESQSSDLTPFLSLVYDNVLESIEVYEANATRRIKDRESYEKFVSQLVKPDGERESQEVAVFTAAMDLLMSHFQRTVNDLRGLGAQVYFKPFDPLLPEKYLQLKRTGRAKRTWAFRVDFRRGRSSARYLFWYIKATQSMFGGSSEPAAVSLLISREEPPAGHYYTSLDDLALGGKHDLPELREVSYDEAAERFVCRLGTEYVSERQVADVVTDFVGQVVARNFAE